MKTILLVEDNRDISDPLSIRLKANHFKVYLAEDAISAVNMAAKHPPDLMLLDIAMPAGDGFTVLDRVNHLPEVVDSPCIFLTASKDPELKDKAKKMGAAAYFEKPFESSELINCIHHELYKIDPSYSWN